jgi:rod shape determining protein RodA
MLKNLWARYDWLLLVMYMSLVIFGWVNIYAVGYDKDTITASIFNFSTSAGKQLLWIGGVGILFIISLFFDTQFYRSLAYTFYVLSIFLLAGTLVWGVQVGGHSSWFQWGGTQLQPTEFVKLTCALAIARRLDNIAARLTSFKTQAGVLLLAIIPVALILLQGDFGSALVFSSFIIVLYREGFPAILLLLGLGVVVILALSLLIPTTYLIIGALGIGIMLVGMDRYSIKRVLTISCITLATICLVEGFEWIMGSVLKPHQQNRIKVLVNPNTDPLGIGWNVMQSKIAIGSGGFWGKGFLNGTQTKYGFVPEQRKDFIFCTIGEEYGWIGTFLFISLFMGLILRILHLAERQRLRFARVYGYGVASVLFFHFLVNVGMTIGLLPVIGIPLPFISYGGSSLWAFSMMLFILLKLDAERNQYVSWRSMAIDLE